MSCANQYLFRLFVLHGSRRSDLALANLQHLCQQHLGERCAIEVVDVATRPELADQERIVATPTLIKLGPLPVRRVIGDLSDAARVLALLDLPAAAPRERTG